MFNQNAIFQYHMLTFINNHVILNNNFKDYLNKHFSNLCSAPVRSILRVDLSALVMNLALEGEGKDTGFVLYREAFFVRTLTMNNAFTIHPLITI